MHLQDEIHNCCFLEFWSFTGWKTPDTQNTALRDRKLIGKLLYLSLQHTELAVINPNATLVDRR